MPRHRDEDDAPIARPDVPRDPPANIIPIRLGDVTVGWAVEELARRLADAPQPHLLIAPGRLPVLAARTVRRGFVIIPQSAIVYVASPGGVVTVHVDGARYWRDGTLADTERRLDPHRFLRIDQSHVVNVERIAELIPWTHQRYRLVFADASKSELMLSRDVGRRLRAALGW